MIQAPKVHFIHVLLGLFGPSVDIPGLGQCIIIMETQFNRNWEKTLYNQGYSCHFENLDDYPAVFVPVKPSLEVIH